MPYVGSIQGDFLIVGALYGLTALDIPAATIVNADISSSAAIGAEKCQKSLAPSVKQAGTCVTATHIVRVVRGTAGVIKHFTVSNVTACVGASTVTVDLKNNGVSVLTAVVTLNAATGALGEALGTIDSPTLADGDVLTVVITAVGSGTDALATGVYAQVDLNEDYLA